MNDSNLNYNNSDNSYRVTSNFNTALENLNADNINSATNINVLGPEYSNGVINQGPVYNNGMINQEVDFHNSVQSNGMLEPNSALFADSTIQSNDINLGTPGVDTFNSNQGNLTQDFSMDSSNNQFITTSSGSNEINNSNSFLGGSAINPQLITNTSAEVYMGGDAITTKKKVTYEPAMDTKKKSSEVVNTDSAKEGLFVIIISLVLIAFVFAMPYIYDFLRNAWLAFVNR